MKVLVTGGAGFIGSHLVEKLVSLEHDVTVIDKNQENIKINLKGVECEKLLCDVNNIGKLLPRYEAIVHLAALADIVPSIERPDKYHEANVNGTFEVLEFARRCEVKKFIYAASGSCYGNNPKLPTNETDPVNPQYPYALTKWIGERYALHYQKVYGLPALSLRFFNIYGPRSRTTGTYGAVFGTFLAQKLAGKPFTVVGDGHQSRDFLYVSDAVAAILAALELGTPGETYNIGSGSHTSIRQLCNLLGGPMEFIPDRPGEPRTTMASILKAQQELKWNPKVTLPQGVKLLLENIDYWKDAPLWDKALIAKATESWFKHLGKDNVRV